MATQNVDIEGTSISASQMLKFFRLASLPGHVNRQTFQAYLEKRNPFEDKVAVQVAATKFVIDIPSNLTIVQMVEFGKYNWVNNLIAKRLQLDQTLVGKWECELLNPTGDSSSEQVSMLCSQDGWQSARIDHTLMFGATYPNEQRKHSVAGLGSCCQDMFDNRVVLVLNSSRRYRDLDLHSWYGEWGSHYRFLRVRRLGT